MKEARYFYVPDAERVGELPLEEATHALRVLRLKVGDELFLMDGKGMFYRAEVSLATNKKCLYNIIERQPQQPSWKGYIHLAMAPTKMMERIEWMAEKCTEIGFNELSFLDCRFSERHSLRRDRIEKIVISAVKQSRKAWMPMINDMVGFKEFISQPRQGRKYICHCYNEIEKKDFFSVVSESLNEFQKVSEVDDITVLVGPEGDFSIDEVRLALDNGYESVSLGSSRLRTETAALMAVVMSNIARRF